MPGQANWVDPSSDVYQSRHRTTDHATEEEHTALLTAAAAAAPVLPQIRKKALLSDPLNRIILLIAFSSSDQQ